MSLKFKGFGFLSLKMSLKQQFLMSLSLAHVHAFLLDQNKKKHGNWFESHIDTYTHMRGLYMFKELGWHSLVSSLMLLLGFLG